MTTEQSQLLLLLLKRIRIIPVTDCWEFQGPKDAYGYGRMYSDNREQKAHRVFFSAFQGVDLPDSVVVQHYLPLSRCTGHACVNPKHLRASTSNKGPALVIPASLPPRKLELLRQVKLIPETNCWEFQGARSTEGYGKLRFEGKQQKAHRVFYLEWGGEIPDACFLHQHLSPGECIGKLCCNPQHMLVSKSSRLPGRAPVQFPAPPMPLEGDALCNLDELGEKAIKQCTNGHLMTGANIVIERRKGYPVARCRTCRQESWRRNSARRSSLGHHT
jgi:hypothetical protein